jgi:hypothetical protein
MKNEHAKNKDESQEIQEEKTIETERNLDFCIRSFNIINTLFVVQITC